MGLDMYLRAKRFIGQHYMPDGKAELEAVLPLIGLPGGCDSYEVQATVGYWRKANQIHNWFVTHVQGGKDECQDSYVSREQLIELRNLCRELTALKKGNSDEVIAVERALEALPPASGFFFGSTDIDDWYWQDVEETIAILDKALALPDNIDFEYHSSW